MFSVQVRLTVGDVGVRRRSRVSVGEHLTDLPKLGLAFVAGWQLVANPAAGDTLLGVN